MKRSVLVWIFTIAQRGGKLAADRQRFRERLSLISKGEPTRDHAVIGCRCRISLGRQHATEIIAGCTALFVHFRDQAGIVGGIGDNCDAFMILCRGTHHGGAANRSEEHPSELQSLMRSSYAVFCLKKTKNKHT